MPSASDTAYPRLKLNPSTKELNELYSPTVGEEPPDRSSDRQQIDLRNVASVTDGTALGEYDRYNMQRMLTLSANISGEDLGHAAARVQQAIRDAGKPPDRVEVTVRGQVRASRNSPALQPQITDEKSGSISLKLSGNWGASAR